MRLSELVDARRLAEPAHGGVEITGITADSRDVRPGYLFAALSGSRADGARFVPAAIEAGAAAILAEAETEAVPVPVIKAEDARADLARIAARFHPRQPGTAIAVTGTSGKTSVASFTRQIWALLGHRAASIGTIGLVTPNGSVYGSLTTPDPVTLHATLDRLCHEDVSHLAMEASSHGLDQRRLDGVRLAAGAFINIERDHLDYHADAEAYFRAKLRLFDTVLSPGAAAVINADAARAGEVAMAARERGLAVFTIGEMGRDLRLVSAEPFGFGQRLRLSFRGEESEIILPLPGGFQATNALVAAGLAIATGSQAFHVLNALESLSGVKGRLELVGRRAGAMVFVDYAHKPDALVHALQALRPYATGRLIALFGAGGDRDPGKRELMGAAAARHADLVVVTDDNPRSEDPAAIRRAIMAGAPDATEIGERARAIGETVAMLGEGDVLLVAGKGHETGQIVGDRVLPFSDHEAVAEAIGAGA